MLARQPVGSAAHEELSPAGFSDPPARTFRQSNGPDPITGCDEISQLATCDYTQLHKSGPD
jgi:hypothetical protein